MSELEDKLNSLLSNQDAMAQDMAARAEPVAVRCGSDRTAGARLRLLRRRAEQRRKCHAGRGRP